jgi:hypothetical protein
MLRDFLPGNNVRAQRLGRLAPIRAAVGIHVGPFAMWPSFEPANEIPSSLLQGLQT